MNYQPINLKEKLSLFSEYWQPKNVARMNDYHFKIAKVQGEFVWHDHPETDEVAWQMVDAEKASMHWPAE